MKTNQNIPISFNPADKNQEEINRQLTEIIRQLWLRSNMLTVENANLRTSITKLLSDTGSIDCKTITADYTLKIGDEYIEADTTLNNITITLIPLAVHKVVYIKWIAGANTLTVNGGGYLIDGVVAYNFITLTDCILHLWDGTKWNIV